MGITLDDAIRLSRELLERCPGHKKGATRLNYCREIINEGSRAVRKSECSVTFREAVEVSLRKREGRRPSTLRELRYICKRIFRAALGICSCETSKRSTAMRSFRFSFLPHGNFARRARFCILFLRVECGMSGAPAIPSLGSLTPVCQKWKLLHLNGRIWSGS